MSFGPTLQTVEIKKAAPAERVPHKTAFNLV